MDLFDSLLSVMVEDLEIELLMEPVIPWDDYYLNPRRLRGSDFLMRWSQGVWSEERLVNAVNETGRFFALEYGPSGTAPTDDIKQVEEYFKKLEHAGLGEFKRPDLLVFRKEDEARISQIVREIGGKKQLPFTPEENNLMQELLTLAIIGLECENSLWKARRMPDFDANLVSQSTLKGRPGLKKNAIVPTVILKDEDRVPLLRWQENRGVKVHIWHVFYDMAFGISLDRAEELIGAGWVKPTKQTFQAPAGPTTNKIIYKIHYYYAYHVGDAEEEPKLECAYVEDKNGHILPYVRFVGGRIMLSEEALRILDEASGR